MARARNCSAGRCVIALASEAAQVPPFCLLTTRCGEYACMVTRNWGVEQAAAALLLAACSGPTGSGPGEVSNAGHAGAPGQGGSSELPQAGRPAMGSGGSGPVANGGSTGSNGGSSGASAGGASNPSLPGVLPQIAFGGGSPGFLASAEIITLTWKLDTEDLSAPLEAFGGSLASSAWWTAASAGYCVPKTTQCMGKSSAATVLAKHVGDFPKTPILDSISGGKGSFKNFILDKAKAGDLPTPDANTLYVFYLPAGMTVTVDGVPSCGYHDSLTIALLSGATAHVPYVVIPRCQQPGLSNLAVATQVASRQIFDAASDPFRSENQVGFRSLNAAWAAVGGEAGDYCADRIGAGDPTTDVAGNTALRVWSNASAAAGHDPCVPAPSGEVYYNVAPEPSTAAGVSLAVGQTVTFRATAFADGPVNDWQIQALEQSASKVLEVSLDRTAVKAGDALNVSVKLAAPPPSTMPAPGGGTLHYARFSIVSKGADGKVHDWPVAVIQK